MQESEKHQITPYFGDQKLYIKNPEFWIENLKNQEKNN